MSGIHTSVWNSCCISISQVARSLRTLTSCSRLRATASSCSSSSAVRITTIGVQRSVLFGTNTVEPTLEVTQVEFHPTSCTMPTCLDSREPASIRSPGTKGAVAMMMIEATMFPTTA
ncbi:unnamed protein product [Prorocentrum cordatum]|uniref:Uncharacterized protein n=1 Tax=Prorocentrum cordatum TaxID=2364126 RepID=A0ABN9PUF8_9DINO|nr:unnamed protein product [Polarella glacialis]